MATNANSNDWTSSIIGLVITLGLIAWAYIWFTGKIEEGPAAPTPHDICMQDETNRLAAAAYAYHQTGKTSGNMFELYATAQLDGICKNKK
jgi:hypothetical protein